MATAPNPVIPSYQGAGLAQASGNVFENFSNLLTKLAFFNLQSKQQQEQQTAENLLRETLQMRAMEQERAQQQAMFGQQTDMMTSRQGFEAEQNALDRALREKELREASKRGDRQDRENRITQVGLLSQGTGLEFNTLWQQYEKDQPGAIANLIKQQAEIEQEAFDALGDKKKQVSFFGARLRDEERQQIETLYRKAVSNPVEWRPKLIQEVQRLRQSKQAAANEPGAFQGIMDFLNNPPAPPAPQGGFLQPPRIAGGTPTF